MAIIADTKVSFRVVETGTGGLGTPTEIHEIAALVALANGTGANQSDRVYSASGTLTATTLDVDLTGALTTKVTGAVNFVELTAIVIRNKSTTASAVLTVGAGSNPVVSPWIATGDGAKIGPGGVFVLTSPIDGLAVVAATGDILRLDSGAATIPYEILLIGRSA
jgi:hypothetical protein